MTDPIRDALEASDDAETDRLMRKPLAALLASIAAPESPYGSGGVEANTLDGKTGCRRRGKLDASSREAIKPLASGEKNSPSRSSALPASTLNPTPDRSPTPPREAGGIREPIEDVK